MFSANLKFLRKRRSRSQDESAGAIGVKRTTWSAYEQGVAEPGFETLIKISDYFKIPIDMLIKQDVTSFPESKIREIEISREADVTGRNLRVIVTTVDSSDEQENIELVPVKAKAGYTGGFADPDYIKVLPTFRLPFLSRERKYRAFPISGDSMPPVSDGSWVTGEYVENWQSVSNGKPYLIVTKNDGIVFKTVFNRLEESGTLLLCSTNPKYDPYEVTSEDILEIWKFVNYISAELPDPNINQKQLTNTVLTIQREVSELKKNLSQVQSKLFD